MIEEIAVEATFAARSGGWQQPIIPDTHTFGGMTPGAQPRHVQDNIVVREVAGALRAYRKVATARFILMVWADDDWRAACEQVQAQELALMPLACEEMARNEIDATTLIRITTVLAESFTDEVGATSGAITKGLVSTLGHVCALMTTTMVADERVVARRDVLTGLENKLAWQEAMVAAAAEEADITIALIDLDGLKEVNDRLGHLEGGVTHISASSLQILSRHFRSVQRHTVLWETSTLSIGRVPTSMHLGGCLRSFVQKRGLRSLALELLRGFPIRRTPRR